MCPRSGMQGFSGFSYLPIKPFSRIYFSKGQLQCNDTKVGTLCPKQHNSKTRLWLVLCVRLAAWLDCYIIIFLIIQMHASWPSSFSDRYALASVKNFGKYKTIIQTDDGHFRKVLAVYGGAAHWTIRLLIWCVAEIAASIISRLTDFCQSSGRIVNIAPNERDIYTIPPPG